MTAPAILRTQFLLDGPPGFGFQIQKFHTESHTRNAVADFRTNIDRKINSAKAEMNLHDGTFRKRFG